MDLRGNANRGSVSTGAYEIANSINFIDNVPGSDSNDWMKATNDWAYSWSGGSSDHDYTSITIGTFSFWMKRGTETAGSEPNYIYSNFNSARSGGFWIDSNERFKIEMPLHGASPITEMRFRDYSAWYHIVLAMDTTQATAANRLKLYVNGNQITDWATAPNVTQNTSLAMIGHGPSWFSLGAGGHYGNNDENSYCGYLAEWHFVDGQQKAATDFGEFNDDGIWVPIKYTGTYGGVGYYLNFEDSSDLGKDQDVNSSSGAGPLDLDLNGISAINQSTDTPTNNFAVLNPLDQAVNNPINICLEGNLRVTATNGDYNLFHSSMAAGSGKWYNEIKIVAVGNRTTHWVMGISDASWNFKDSTHVWGAGDGATDIHDLAWSWFSANDLYNGTWDDSTIITSSNTTTANGDIYMHALDCDNGKAWFGKNGTWFSTSGGTGNPATGANAHISNLLTRETDNGVKTSMLRVGYGYYNDDTNSRSYQVNFGNPTFSISSGNADGDGYGNFEYAPPSGFYAWCTKNLAEYG